MKNKGVINCRSSGVFLAGFVMVFLFTGSFKANGVLYWDSVLEYQTSNFLAGSTYVLQASVAFTIAGVAGSIFKGASNRVLGVTGGFLFGLGFICEGLIGESLWQLSVFMGITAIGGGLLHFAMFMAYLEHFQDKFSVAFSARELNTYIGVSAMPPLMDYCRSYYGTHSSYLLLGAISWNCIVCGVLLKPAIGFDERGGTFRDKPLSFMMRLRESVGCMPTDTSFNNVCYKILAIFSHSPVMNHPNFAIFLVIHSIFYYTFTAWALYLVPFGTSLGYPSHQAVYLSTAGGIGGFCGKLLAIMIFHMNKMTIISGALLPSCTVCTGLFVYIVTSNYSFLIFASFICGFGIAYADSALNGMIPSYLCNNHLRQGSAISYLYAGILMQCGGSLSGAILDVTSSFTWLFSAMIVSHLGIGVLSVVLQLRQPEGFNCKDTSTEEIALEEGKLPS
ncbi:monocarboxylate transporter 12-like isoform X1 [Apostichopus japonicus]|uniref:monocarboxylate transporter 12-like isoform X1 n=1 Tax=Stichopus japonicus TaxID=307972 RepID=UPI003AB64ABC